MTFQFEKLLVYQKAIDLPDVVCSATEQFSRGYGLSPATVATAAKRWFVPRARSHRCQAVVCPPRP